MKQSLKGNRRRAQESERQAAAALGGKVRLASGALPGMKGDVYSSEYLLEDKVTSKKSFSMTFALWRKLTLEAFYARKTPVFRINFESESTALYVVDEETWIRLTKKTKKQK